MSMSVISSSRDLSPAYKEGLPSRNNYLENYLHLMPRYFRCIDEKRFNAVPAPLSVQVQISARCATRCVMCQHWREGTDGLSLEQWENIFTELSLFGVQTVTFSGGEPLLRPDFVLLLESAVSAGLRVGMLTSGMMQSGQFYAGRQVLDAIAEHVDWIQVSVDGLEVEDTQIRNSIIPGRFELLREFFECLRNKRPWLSIALTIQKANINSDLASTCRALQYEFRPNDILVKLATGSNDALSQHTSFLPDLPQLLGFLMRLQNASTENSGSNLAYLARSFKEGVFSAHDVAQGAPVRSFYTEHQIRCYTPYLFSLIDSDGQVYPCCHLFRDNHSFDPKTAEFRARHHMGNAATTKFRDIWNGPGYADERRNLLRIDPHQPGFTACGECTRHCRHNIALTQFHAEYSTNPGILDNTETPADRPIWF